MYMNNFINSRSKLIAYFHILWSKPTSNTVILQICIKSPGKSIIIPVATKNLKHYLSEDQRRLTLQSTSRRGIKVKHTVRPGDTFWDISRKYKVKFELEETLTPTQFKKDKFDILINATG